ncbi:MAG: C40 family peptidase [Gammaproteobacteria bacterium]|nr:C40 family peptidase [Gammaproteobacteria bacterium]
MGKATPQFLLLTVVLTLLAACSSTPDYPPRAATPAPRQDTHNTHAGVSIAVSMLGTPYRYGGSSPHGFDCSGLVYYSYRRAGIHVPRTTYAQMNAANRVRLRDLAAGDLLFFRLGRQPVSHVAIYTGDGQFIHAPSSGKRVSYGSMSDAYWKTRLVAAGRF